MKLVENGTPGILVDMDHIRSMVTTDAIDAELNRIGTGSIDMVIRDHDTVVSPDEYMNFLTDRRQKIQAMPEKAIVDQNKAALEKMQEAFDEKANKLEQAWRTIQSLTHDNEILKAAVKDYSARLSEPTPVSIDVQAEMKEKDIMIERLLNAAKKSEEKRAEAEASAAEWKQEFESLREDYNSALDELNEMTDEYEPEGPFDAD